LAGVMTIASFARFRVLVAKFKEKTVTSRRFDQWVFASTVKTL